MAEGSRSSRLGEELGREAVRLAYALDFDGNRVDRLLNAGETILEGVETLRLDAGRTAGAPGERQRREHAADRDDRGDGDGSDVHEASEFLPTHTTAHARLVCQPHSENPHTWHFTHPSANSSWDPQSGHVPMNDCVYPLMSNPSCTFSAPWLSVTAGADTTGVTCSRAGTPA